MNIFIIKLYFLILYTNFCYGVDDYFLGVARQELQRRKLQSTNSNTKDDEQKCINDLYKYMEALEANNSWAIYMSDASASGVGPGELPKGTWSGNLAHLGNGHDQCLNINTGLIHGAYCIITIPLEQTLAALKPHIQRKEHVHRLQEFIRIFQVNTTYRYYMSSYPVRIRLAVCLPHTCTPEVVNELKLLPPPAKMAHCHTKQEIVKYQAVNKLDISFLIFLLMIIALMIGSTYKEWRNKGAKKEDDSGRGAKALAAFSLLTNGKELFSTNTGSEKQHIDCISGMRVISLIWIMSMHCFVAYLYVPFKNPLQYVKLSKYDTIIMLPMFQISVPVDTFFCISGLVMTYTFLRQHASTSGLFFNPIRHYIHRYVRLTPSLAVLLWVHVSVLRWAGELGGTPGPLWHEDGRGDGVLLPLAAECRTYWWAVLMHVQNYVCPNNLCLEHTWYIMSDMQLTIFSPIVLMFLASKASMPRKIKVLAFVVVIVSALCFGVFFHFGYNAVLYRNTNISYPFWYYLNTFIKCSPWIIGCLFGYFIYEAQNYPDVNKWLTKKSRLIGTICLLILFFSYYGPIFLNDLSEPVQKGMSKLYHALYNALTRPLWAIAIATIIYTTHVVTSNSIMSKFLSHAWFQILAKLSYTMYLTHMTLLYIRISQVKQSIDFSMLLMIQESFGNIVQTIILSIFWTLAFEMPFIKLEKMMFSKNYAKSVTNGSTLNNNDTLNHGENFHTKNGKQL